MHNLIIPSFFMMNNMGSTQRDTLSITYFSYNHSYNFILKFYQFGGTKSVGQFKY